MTITQVIKIGIPEGTVNLLHPYIQKRMAARGHRQNLEHQAKFPPRHAADAEMHARREAAAKRFFEENPEMWAQTKAGF